MKAPNKVYIRKEKDNVIYSLSVQHNNGGEEYIRKEALLEWAESMKYCGDEYTHIYVKELIDKLNSI